MALKLKPLGNRLVIEPIEEEEVTAGGIVLPETAKEKPQKGKVLATGDGDRDGYRRRWPRDLSGGPGRRRRMATDVCRRRLVRRE